MKFSLVCSLATIASVLPVAWAHGYVEEFRIGGKTYRGPAPAQGKPFWNSDTPLRQLAALEPFNDLNSPFMSCGRGAADSARLIAPVTAGSDFSFTMISGTGGKWPHKAGPVQAYLGKCPGSASTCVASRLQWFKAASLSLKSVSSKVWWQNDLSNGQSLTMTIPKNIRNGDYLLRLEITALHIAANVGGAELSVSCAQIRVSGGTGATPSGNQLIKFPGGYRPTDPGLLVDIWNGNLVSYKPAGPAPFTGGTTGKPTARPTATNVHTTTPGRPVTNIAPRPSSTSVAPPNHTKICRHRRNRRAIVIDGRHSHGRRAAHGGPARFDAIH